MNFNYKAGLLHKLEMDELTVKYEIKPVRTFVDPKSKLDIKTLNIAS